MLAKVDIRVRVNPIPKAQFFAKLDKLDTSFFLLGWGGAEIDAQPTLDLLSHSFDPVTRKGDDNYGRFANPALDALIDAAGVETDPARRQRLIGDALNLQAEQVHYLPLHRQVLPWVMRKGVHPVHAANNHFRAWLTRVEAAADKP
jgi:peptide/nickel transport system substrate-binding protein